MCWIYLHHKDRIVRLDPFSNDNPSIRSNFLLDNQFDFLSIIFDSSSKLLLGRGRPLPFLMHGKVDIVHQGCQEPNVTIPTPCPSDVVVVCLSDIVFEALTGFFFLHRRRYYFRFLIDCLLPQ